MKISIDKEYYINRPNVSKIVIYNIKNENESDYPVIGCVDYNDGTYILRCWTINGEDVEDDTYDLIEKNHLKLDQKILVSNDGVNWIPSHFSRVNESGQILVWIEGRTSWTSKCDIEFAYWKYGFSD